MAPQVVNTFWGLPELSRGGHKEAFFHN